MELVEIYYKKKIKNTIFIFCVFFYSNDLFLKNKIKNRNNWFTIFFKTKRVG